VTIANVESKEQIPSKISREQGGKEYSKEIW
jgi:hypothetical protein